MTVNEMIAALVRLRDEHDNGNDTVGVEYAGWADLPIADIQRYAIGHVTIITRPNTRADVM